MFNFSIGVRLFPGLKIDPKVVFSFLILQHPHMNLLSPSLPSSATTKASHRERHRGYCIPGGEHPVCPRHDRLTLLALFHRGPARQFSLRTNQIQGQTYFLLTRRQVLGNMSHTHFFKIFMI